MSLIGKGRVFTETRIDPCGACTCWYVVMFVDGLKGQEREVARCLDAKQAEAIRGRWAKETCFSTPAFGAFKTKRGKTAGNAFRRNIIKKTDTETELKSETSATAE